MRELESPSASETPTFEEGGAPARNFAAGGGSALPFFLFLPNMQNNQSMSREGVINVSGCLALRCHNAPRSNPRHRHGCSRVGLETDRRGAGTKLMTKITEWLASPYTDGPFA